MHSQAYNLGFAGQGGEPGVNASVGYVPRQGSFGKAILKIISVISALPGL